MGLEDAEEGAAEMRKSWGMGPGCGERDGEVCGDERWMGWGGLLGTMRCSGGWGCWGCE